MKITTETLSKEVKEATLRNIGKLPKMEVNYVEGSQVSDDQSNQYWIDKVCESHSNS